MSPTGDSRPHTRPRGFAPALLAAVCALACVAALPAGAAAKLPGRPAPAAAQCSAAHGTFSWDSVWRVDTTVMPGSQGYTCTFRGPAEGGTATYDSLASDPSRRRWETTCRAVYGGRFSVFEARLGETTVYAGYECEWLGR